ncbi:MAG: Rpn family recombination-promoting nuclease/putative transposase [Planctomycetaceae bacterium]|jgi:predicted transposase/invertase (TIGR01784 family)|nr:Rpn family recombination-promoting nuclease/putative transposase [Planctomycetaceae bacterium]
MPRYINPYTDFGFKKLFGEEANKDLLVDFLNSQLPEEHQIKTLTFRNTEKLGMSDQDRKTIYDIYCVGANGDHFIVEMQKARQKFFKDRSLFGASFLIRDQAPQGFVNGKPWDFELKAIYLFAVLGFEYDQEEERRKFCRDVQFRDQDGDLFYDKLQFRFLQMSLFTKTESELESRSDMWYYFLKHLESFETIPLIFREPVFERALETAEIARFNKDEALQYEMSLMSQWDNYSVLQTAKEEGLAEGEAKGKAEGLAEGKTEKQIEIARNLKQMGLSAAYIAKATGLTVEEIDWLDS